MTYDFQQIETRWQGYWAEQKTFRTPNPGQPANGKLDPSHPKFYVLDMFPYPSGVGLHVGHPLGYIATDIVARYKRMRGFNVLHPMGFDAFGLPAEQFAVEHGVHPRLTTEKNIANMVRQLKRLGLGYDWDRSFATTDVDYYKWTQWIFLKLYGSWFDPASGSGGKARPIDELEQALRSEEYYVGLDGELIHAGAMEDLGPVMGDPIGARKWSELSETQQRALLDEYRLAYLAEVPVNWCPALGTVLANEEVTNDGRSERGNHPVFKRPLKQWMLRITAYAERLIDELEQVDWPEPIKLMQRNWIGRSEGAEVEFALVRAGASPPPDADGAAGDGPAHDEEESITVFTTRPDTLFGATYMVLAPEHALVDAITTDEQRTAVDDYRRQAASRSDVDRQAETKTKTGVFTGAYAVNPVNDEPIPIWIADYVMMGYGTGAIMAVPAHDQRDHDFAKQFGLRIIEVVRPEGGEHGHLSAYAGDGVHVNSEHDDLSINGLNNQGAKTRTIDWLESKGVGRGRVQYKLRDWLFSRQRYWGEPFPIMHAPDGAIVPVPESSLPVDLPAMEDFKPHASDDPNADVQTPLSRAPDSWKYLDVNGTRFTRELNTMPQWAGSCWYYLRFLDPENNERFVDPDVEQYWMQRAGSSSSPDRENRKFRGSPGGVDLYVGGAEHAVLHLLYARFWHKVLYDLGYVSTPEPFGKLFNQGYIQAHAYTDSRGVYVPADEVEEVAGDFLYRGAKVTREFGKMGKSLKNAVTPDDVADQYGTDTLRLYEMYMGPLDQSKVWNTRDIVGVHRFLQRIWRNLIPEAEPPPGGSAGGALVTDDPASEPLRRKLHHTIKRVTEAMETMTFNVAIAALIELNNEIVPLERIPREVADPLVRMLAPLAPHIGEELWQRLGHEPSVADADWPAYDASLLVEDQIEYPVQVNGKLRGKVTVPAEADDDTIVAAVKQDEKVAAAMDGKTLRKAIVIKGRLVNLVVG